MRVDLHIHTTASDGCWTPEEVIAGVLAEGIGLFSVTDHDSVANVASTAALIRNTGLAFLQGTEISTMDDGVLFHILGYGIAPAHPGLSALLAENRAKLEATDDSDIQKLIALGYPMVYEDYLAYDYDLRRGGFKSLNYLVDQGFCTGPHDFFDNLRAKLDHQWPNFVHPTEAIAAIRAAGGAPVLAHPGSSLKHHGDVTEATLAPLLDYGIQGLESYSQYHDAETTAFCVDWCERHGLLITGGSDYHGGFVGRQLGEPPVDTADLRLGELTAKIIRG